MKQLLKLTSCLLAAAMSWAPAQAQITGAAKDVAPLCAFRYPGTIHTVHASPANRFLAAGGNTPSLYVWDLQTKKLAKKLTPKGNEIRSVHFSADGKTLAAHSHSYNEDDYLTIWNTTTWKLIQSDAIPTRRIEDWGSDNNSYLAADKAVKPYGITFGVWSIPHRRWTTTITLKGDEPLFDGARFAGNKIVAVTKEGKDIDNKLSVFNRETGAFLRKQSFGTFSALDLATSNNGQFLAVSGLGYAAAQKGRVTAEHFVQVWNLEAWKLLWKFPAGRGLEATDIAFSPDAKVVAVGLGNHQGIRLISTENGKPGKAYNIFPLHATVATFSHDSQQLIAGGLNGEVVVWKIGK